KTSCMNNFKQIGLGTLMYCGEYNNYTWNANAASDTQLLYKGGTTLNGGWNSTGLLLYLRYLDDQMVFHCPAVTSPGKYYYSMFKMSNIDNPSYYWGSDYRHRICNIAYGPYKVDKHYKKAFESDKLDEQSEPYQQRPYHQGGFNVLYLDGVVKFIKGIPATDAGWASENWFRDNADR
ncbi:MAG: DUF1559 domain-containing protein, partial [Planctomycetes bacterium]|nr:DUF1559 domain-containing protein [Planctomycetota bacterium]